MAIRKSGGALGRPVVGQLGGEVYGGIEQPDQVMRGLHNAVDDPLGLGLQRRGLEHKAAYEASEREKDPFHLSGPLASPQWEGYQEALGERGIAGLGGVKGVGPSQKGSTQLTGQSVQPDYLTTGISFMGHPNADYRGTMFAPGQTDPGTKQTFEEQERYKHALSNFPGANQRALTGLQRAI